MNCFRLYGSIATVGLALALAACGGSAQDTSTNPRTQAASLVSAGLAAQRAGRTSEASSDYHRALQTDPTNKYAYYDLGVIEQQQGQNAEAEKDYRAALQLDPNMTSALYNLAIIRTPADPTEAESLYRHVISVQPTNAAAHLNLGFLLLSLNHVADAKAELAQAVKLDPSLAARIPSPLPSPTGSPAP